MGGAQGPSAGKDATGCERGFKALLVTSPTRLQQANANRDTSNGKARSTVDAIFHAQPSSISTRHRQ